MIPGGSCLICGEPDRLGLAVCPACGGTAEPAADKLLFVVPAGNRTDHLTLRDRIARAVGGSPQAEAVEAVSRGYRAMARVPAAAAPAALETLAGQGIVAHEVAGPRSWAAIPMSFLVLLLLALGAGLKAGWSVEPAMLVLTPLFVGLLGVSAWRGSRRPLYAARGQDRPAVPPLLVRVLAELPDGEARDLTVGLARSVARVLAGDGITDRMKAELEAMLPHAAEAASDLSALDQALADLEARGEEEDLPAPVIRAIDDMEHARHRLAQYLAEVVGVVGRLHGLSADALDSAGERLALVTAGLRGEIDTYQEVLGQFRSTD